MPVTITTIMAKQFSPRLLILSQQRQSRFEGKVRRETVANAEDAYFDTIDAEDEPEQATVRHGDTPLTESKFGRRRVTPYKWDKGTLLDDADIARMQANPQGVVLQSFAMSFGRKKDDLIIEAAFADASIGKTGAGTVEFKDESISIDGTTGGIKTTLGTLAVVSTPVTMELKKMLTMTEIFMEAEVDPEIARYWAVAPKDITSLLNIAEVKSSDYNTLKVLAQGKIDTYMGYNLFYTNRLQRDAATETAFRTIAWAQDGIILALIGDLTTSIDKRVDKKNVDQIYSKMDLGAVRMEGAKVHECLTVV